MKWYTERPTKSGEALIEVTYQDGYTVLAVGVWYHRSMFWEFPTEDGLCSATSNVRWTPITDTRCGWHLLEAPCSDD